MSVLTLKIIDQNDKVKYAARGEDEVVLVNACAYQEGDRISLEVDKSGTYVWLQLDDAVGRRA